MPETAKPPARPVDIYCGAIIDSPEFFNEYSGIKNLQILADIKKKIGEKEIEHYFSVFGLNDKSKTVRKYSLGMKQRLALAQAFMESPEFIVLDEFSNGLDKHGVEFVRKYIKDYSNNETIIILTSHYDEDLSILCDEVYKIEDGEVSKYDV
jgi:ABC-2 type transport system ATP-binding protein